MKCREADLRAKSGGYLPRDFVETRSGHLFALVTPGVEDGRVLASLRYAKQPNGQFRKFNTAAALAEVRRLGGRWDYQCPKRHVRLQAVPVEDIERLHKPTEAWQRLISGVGSFAAENLSVQNRALQRLGEVFHTGLGVTGSHLIGAATASSDIDLVAYGSQRFTQCRSTVGDAIRVGKLQDLSENQWRETYRRRGCDLTLDEYLWHEKRKGNKFSVGGLKVDLSCVAALPAVLGEPSEKIRRMSLQAEVVDDQLAFATPAIFGLDHEQVCRVVCFTPTYTGQAVCGERIEAAGWLERTQGGEQMLVVGTSREAAGEYLRVVSPSGKATPNAAFTPMKQR